MDHPSQQIGGLKTQQGLLRQRVKEIEERNELVPGLMAELRDRVETQLSIISMFLWIFGVNLAIFDVFFIWYFH